MKGAQSFRYKFVLIQVVSIHSEVVSIQTLSQFDTTVVNAEFLLLKFISNIE